VAWASFCLLGMVKLAMLRWSAGFRPTAISSCVRREDRHWCASLLSVRQRNMLNAVFFSSDQSSLLPVLSYADSRDMNWFPLVFLLELALPFSSDSLPPPTPLLIEFFSCPLILQWRP